MSSQLFAFSIRPIVANFQATITVFASVPIVYSLVHTMTHTGCRCSALAYIQVMFVLSRSVWRNRAGRCRSELGWRCQVWYW